jgi:dihydropteroate synthase
MKKLVLAFVLSLCMTACAFASDAALTPAGQSPDGMMVRVVLKSLKVTTDYEALLKPEALTDQKVLIIVPGASSKGMGAAGINAEDELARAKALCDAAAAKKIKVLVMHVGGEGRRGATSDKFIDTVSPYADAFIVVDGGNTDGKFTKLAEDRKVKLLSATNVRNTKEPLKEILTEWGVL